MIDYGALQPSPVQKPLDPASSNTKPDRTIVRDSVAHEPAPLSAHTLISPLSNGSGYTPPNIPSYSQWNPSPQQQQQQNSVGVGQGQGPGPLGLEEGFDGDFDFDFATVDMEALGFATQDFWGSFPGEVGTYL
jgi:hypothetical protein